MRKFYWYFTAYLRKHGIVFVLSLLAAIGIFSAFIPTIVESIEKRERHYIAIIGQYSLADLPEIIEDQLSAGLTRIDENGSVQPLLAQRWTIEQEGKTYRFVLNEDIRWQDGSLLKPEDIHYQFDDVETIITPNDIVFQLPAAFAPFPAQVSAPLFKSAQKPYLFFLQKPTLIGIGEYSIEDYSLQGNYLKEMVIDSPTERYTYRFYLTEDDAVTAFKQGKVDILLDLAQNHDVYTWDTVSHSSTVNTDQYVAVFFNMRDGLFQKNVRQALSYALEKPSDDTRTIGPINPDSWAYLAGGKGYEYDVDRAVARLLDDVPRQPLELELTTTTLFEMKAEEIKRQWEEFGQKAYEACQANSDIEEKELCENTKISLAIRVSNFPDTSNFQLLLIGQQIPPDPDQYQLWHSEQSTNFTGYKNTRIDTLLERGRQTFEQNERKEIYQEFQQFFLEDPPAIFLEFLTTHQVTRKDLF